MKKKKETKPKFKTYDEFVDKASIDAFEPPEYVVQPAAGDTGFALVKAHFNKMMPMFTPGIKSVK